MAGVIFVIFILICVLGFSVSLNSRIKNRKADIAAMPEGVQPLGYGFYRTLQGDIWYAREHVTGVHAEVNATQRYSLTRAATVVGAATKKTDGTLVVRYTDPRSVVQIKTVKVGNATAWRAAMAFAAKINAVAGQLPHQGQS